MIRLRARLSQLAGEISRLLGRLKSFLPLELGGSLWFYSPSQTKRIQAIVSDQFSTVTAGFPNSLALGSAYVRLGARPHATRESLDFAVVIDDVGHLGNRLIRVGNAILLAQLGRTSKVFYRPLPQAPKAHHRPTSHSRLPESSGFESKEFGLYPVQRRASAGLEGRKTLDGVSVLWNTLAMQGVKTFLLDSESQAFGQLAAYLRETLDVRPTRKAGTNTLTIHLRSGDIFGRRPHPAYGQPPWIFYKAILDSASWKTVILVQEDDANPVGELISEWCSTKRISLTVTGKVFSEAVEAVAGATNLVLSRGTFLAAIAALFPKPRHIYVFGKNPPEPWFNPDDKLTAVVDKRGLYEDVIFGRNWRNLEWQRRLMKSYSGPVAFHREVGFRKRAG